ncbi:hypothetical protein MCELHM10_03505 [Paracoccaceae bacterium]|jgi:hypothetical protein
MPIPHRLVAALLIGSSGTLVMLSMLGTRWGGDWPFVIAAAIGAGASGFLYADCLGLPGRRGLGLCLLGAILTTVTGAAVAGLGLGIVVAMTPAGLFFGPMAVAQALLTSLPVLVTWIVTMTAAHLVMGQIRTRHLMPS